MTSLAPEYANDYPIDTTPAHSRESALRSHMKRTGARLGLEARRLGRFTRKAFTKHPAETRETYFQHLWFTTKTSLRFATICVVLFLHGVFPFLFTRTASKQIERVYLIMRSRISEARREIIKAEYDI